MIFAAGLAVIFSQRMTTAEFWDAYFCTTLGVDTPDTLPLEKFRDKFELLVPKKKARILELGTGTSNLLDELSGNILFAFFLEFSACPKFCAILYIRF